MQQYPVVMLSGTIIAQICLALGPNVHQEACHKAVESGMIQTEIKQNMDKFESYTTNRVTQEVREVVIPITGETIWIVVGTTIKIYRDKQVRYPIKILNKETPLLPVVEPTVNFDGTGSVMASWNFRF